MIDNDSMSRSMNRLIDVLDERASAAHPVSFWLRDDDAIEPSKALDRLLDLTARYSIPLTLAVIPAYTGDALAQRLSAIEEISVAVHGWSHTNHAGPDEKKQELGNHRDQSDILGQLQHGSTHLARLHQSRYVPLLVPPWNRISPEIVAHLSKIGFKGLSVFGEESTTGILSINTQVDIIDWKGTRGGRAVIDLIEEIMTLIHNDKPLIGILTHHLVHDEHAWQFLEALLAVTSKHSGVRWVSVGELLEV